MKRPDAETHYARLMLAAARLWRQMADRALAGLPVSASSGWTLFQLARLGEDVRQIELARALDITGPSLVRLIDQLQRDELVRRDADPTDGRAICLKLTPRGRIMAGEIEEILAKVRHELLAGISDEDLTAAIRVARHVETRAGNARAGI